jgi:glc operon protein GlcG
VDAITHQDIVKGLSAGLAEAERRGVIVAISIVDEGPNLLGAVRMSGSGYPWLCNDAQGKAMATVVWKGTPSGELQERAGSPMMNWLNNHYGGRLNYLKGAVPITRDGNLIGAAGVGGAPTPDDEAIATVVAKIIGD